MNPLPIKLILIDNLDSFSYNLVDEIRSMGFEMLVYRNTAEAHTIAKIITELQLAHSVILMISPGPGSPSESGCVPELLQLIKGKVPVLGICLGHQAIVEAYGGKVSRAPCVMHGKSSYMTFINSEQTTIIFSGLPNPMSIARYHSLAASQVPKTIQVIAEIDGLPMAVLHANDKMLGFQFHPESILTSDGSKLLNQSIQYLIEAT